MGEECTNSNNSEMLSVAIGRIEGSDEFIQLFQCISSFLTISNECFY